MQITAKVGKDGTGPSATVEYDMPETLENAVKKFGEDVVYNKFVDAVTIDVQAGMRRQLVDKTDKDGKVTSPAKSQEEIQAWANEYRPSAGGGVRLTAVEKATNAIKSMTQEQRAALLAELTAG